MSYKIELTEQADIEIQLLKKSDLPAYKKLLKLLSEIALHPYTGTGLPKPMKYGYAGCYSRRITQKHRLVYSVDDEEITVLIISASGHYGDK